MNLMPAHQAGAAATPEGEVVNEAFAIKVDSWTAEALQGWISQLLEISCLHVKEVHPEIKVSLMFSYLGTDIKEKIFIRWVTTFDGLLEYSEKNKKIISGIRFDVKGNEYSGMVYVKTRNVGIKQIVQRFFDGMKGPFRDQRVKVYEPSRDMRYQGKSSPDVLGGARFEDAIYDIRQND